MPKSYFGVNAPQVGYYQPGSGYLVDAMKSAEPHWASGGYIWGDVPLQSTLLPVFEGTGTVSGNAQNERFGANRLVRVSVQGDVRNLSLLRQGVGGDGVFTTPCVESLKPAGVIRLMDWLKTNGSPVVKWSDRCKQSDQLWSGPNGGPYETWLAYAVREGKDLWLNVPHAADDDYVRQLATLCKLAIGDAPVNLYLEDSNECWNDQFPQYKWQATRGGQRWHADRTIFIAREFRKVFATDDDRIRPVLGCGIAFPFQRDEALTQIGARTSELYGIAIAPYFGSWLPSNHTGWTAQQYADFALTAANGMGGPTSNTTKGVRQYKAICDKLKVKLLAYEGGLDFGQGEANKANRAAAQLLPQAGQAVETYLEWWRKEGGDVFCYFNQISLWNQSGVWGLESLPGQRGPKWQAWKRVADRHQRGEVPPPPTPTPPPPPVVQPITLNPPEPQPDGRLKWTWSKSKAPYTLFGPGTPIPSTNEDAYTATAAGDYWITDSAGGKSNTVRVGVAPDPVKVARISEIRAALALLDPDIEATRTALQAKTERRAGLASELAALEAAVG